MLGISVNASNFTISNGNDFLTKNKEDIIVCVGNSSDIVEIYETTPVKSQRVLIVAASYDQFTSPTGTTALNVVTEIIKLINRNNNCTSDHYVTTSQTITECGKWRCDGLLTLTLDASVLIKKQVIQIWNVGGSTVSVSGGGLPILYANNHSVSTFSLNHKYESLTLTFYGTYYIVT